MPQQIVRDETTGQLVVVREGETPETAVARSRQRRPEALGMGILNPADQPKGDLTKFGEPSVLRDIVATGLKGGAFGASIIPGLGLPAIATRMGLTGLLGGAANKVEGQDFTTGLATNMAGEGAAGTIAKYAPRVGTSVALRLSNLRQSGPERSALTDAFMRERGRGKLGSGIAVGDAGKSGARLKQVGAQIPKLEKAYDASRVGRPVQTPSPFSIETNFGGVDAADVATRAGAATKPISLLQGLAKEDRDIYIQQVAFHYKIRPDQLRMVELAQPGTIERLAENAHLTANRLGDLARTSASEGGDVIKAREAGTFIEPAEQATKGQLPAARADRINTNLDSLVPGRRDVRRRYADVAKINEANQNIHSSVGQASVRGGLGAGLGGGLSSLIGMNPGVGAGVGGALGLMATPQNISRGANLTGRLFEPTAYSIQNLPFRGTDIIEDILTMVEKRRREKQEAAANPVGRRQP